MARKQAYPYNYSRRVKKTLLVNEGADADSNPLLSTLKEGKYRDAHNMRLNADGSKLALEKTYGEEAASVGTIAADLLALGATGHAAYKCLGSKIINGYLVSFHAHATPGGLNYPCIAIDGRVVLFSSDFPLNASYAVQLDINETGYGGEIFVNDTQSVPMIFNVQDLLTEWNAGSPTSKYFADFDINNYIVRLSAPMDQPVFIRLENVGGVTGLPPGGYSYCLRYVDDDGNGTSWGPSTPIIPVVANMDEAGIIYKGVSTYGKVPDPTTNTKYGVRIRFRITNDGDFSYIEIRRIAHISGQYFTIRPQSEKLQVSTIDIRTNPYTIIDFIDTSDKDWQTLDDFTNEEMANISKVNAIKYYNNKLTLHGITYTTKIIDQTNLFLESESGNIAYPYIKSLGDIGFNKIRNQVYFKSYMHGERYGWAFLGHDGIGGRTFAIPYRSGVNPGVDDFTNYMIPNRREPVSLDTSEFSSGKVTCADVSSNTGASPSETHEVMDNNGAVQKSDSDYINVLAEATTPFVYNPLSPTGDKSNTTNKTNTRGHNHVMTKRVRHDGSTYYTYPSYYNPEGWGHGIYSQGMSFEGVDETLLPDHIKSFSIVRTQPAGRVLCQGIGFYSIEEQTATNPAHKALDEFWFYSPDIDQGVGLNPGLFDDIINNPSGYQIQLVSPVGFFSEVFSGYDESSRYEAIDMISYARILYENNKFNYGDADTNVGHGDGYVSFGRWRNTVGGSTGIESDTSEEYIFDISGAVQNNLSGREGRSMYLKLTVAGSFGTGNLYLTGSGVTAGVEDFDDTEMKAWHEPLYICNIIANEASVPPVNVTEYIDTGFHQKLRSVIGFSDGVNIQQYKLVDERPDDCRYLSHIYSRGSHTGAANSAVLTDSAASWGVNELVGYYIINISDLSSAIIISNTSNTVTATLSGGTDNDWDIADVYGIYCHKYVYVNGKAWWTHPLIGTFPTYEDCMDGLTSDGYWHDGNRNIYGICLCYEKSVAEGMPSETIVEFNQDILDALYPSYTGYAAGYYVPVVDDKIEVWYDNRAPLKVFGGDTFIGDALFVPIDSSINPALDPYESCFHLDTGFPYFVYQMQNIVQMFDTLDIPLSEEVELEYIRQMAVLFTCESKVNLPLLYNDSFPKKNYVQRPMHVDVTQWDNGAEAMYTAHKFSKEYMNEYGDEYLTWLYGGFHFPGVSNIDYSKSLIDRTSYNQPLVGFTERLYYPDRSIWSVLRINPGEIDSLRVFPALNAFDGSDLSGPIRFAWASNTGKGDNIYKITDRGVCILLTDKKLLSDFVGGEIGAIGSSEGFIQAEYWLSRDVGMTQGMWISAAWVGNNLFFANTESAYWLADNEVRDIGILDYHDKLYSRILADEPTKSGTALTSPRGLINLKNEEYWICSGRENRQHVFNYREGKWVGEFGYVSRMFCSDRYTIYGLLNQAIYLIGSDSELDHACYVDFAINPNPGMMFQFKEIEIFSSHKPTSVQFSDVEFTVQATLDEATFGPYYLKDKGSYQNKIPRKTADGSRFNGPVLFIRINYDAETSFTLSAINIVANQLKSQ